MRNRRIRRSILFSIVLLFAILFIIDRYYWAQLAQWREDQSTNLWLGYTEGLRHMPVGLISSQQIPNPNGMLLLGSILSLLPSLLSVSFFLGLVQAALLLMVGWKASLGDWKYFALATLPAISSVLLRSSSVEFWNQYTITLVNIFFIFWALRYLEKPSLWNIPPIVALALLAPSIYLAGIVNAAVIAIITIGMLVYKRPERTHLWPVVSVTAALILVSVLVTWWPYYQNVSLTQFVEYTKNSPGLVVTFGTFWKSLLGSAIYGTLNWADQSTFTYAIKHADKAILTQRTEMMLGLVARAYLLQAVFAFMTALYFIYVALQSHTNKEKQGLSVHYPAVRLVVLSVLFICLSYTISTLMGGPLWVNGARPDQRVQFLPLFLFFIFLLPVVTKIDNTAGRIIQGISYFSLILFVTANLLCGFMIIRDYLQYRGDVLTEADIPLIDKERAVEFIAIDWRKHSNASTIPVDYDLGGGRWDWVPKFGRKLTKWYAAPMTDGRGFDYELLRRYGLTNAQEGVQLRTFGNGRYLLTYAFEDPPQVESNKIKHYIFGRLRVSIIER